MPTQSSKRLLFPLAIFGLWLVTLLGFICLSAAFSNHRPNITTAVSNWDGGWYQSIAAGGYTLVPGQQSNVAFFPLYPLLVAAIHQTGIPIALSASLLSVVSFGGALLGLFELARRQFNEQVAKITIALLAFSPFSFFFAASYSESLFLLITVATLLLVHRRQWLAAAIVAGLGSGTRAVGVLLALVVVASYIKSRDWHTRPFHTLSRAGALGLIGISGLIGFMTYLHITFHNALAFQTVQQYWPGRNENVFALKRAASNLLDPSFSNPYFLNLTEALSIVVFTALSIYVLLKINTWWGLLCLAAIAIPLYTGTTISLNRYTLVLVPCFIAAAYLIKTWERAIFVIIPSVIGLAFFLNLFIMTNIFIG